MASKTETVGCFLTNVYFPHVFFQIFLKRFPTKNLLFSKNSSAKNIFRFVEVSGTQTVVRRCFSKLVFLKISQYLHENTCVEISV